MRSLELHVFETDEDIDSGLQAGLLELDDLDETACSECAEQVGNVNGVFEPFVVSLNEEDLIWITCSDCAAPVINRHIELEWAIEFSDFSEEVDGMIEATFEEPDKDS